MLGFVLLCSTQLTAECSQTQVHLVGKGSTNIGVNLSSNAYPTSILPHPQPPPLAKDRGGFNTARLRILNWNLVWGKGEPARSWGFPP